MPVLSDLTIVQRKNIILEIARRMQLNPEEKLETLCEVMGISEGVYHYWIREDPEMIETFRQMIIDLSREELTLILAMRMTILQRLITDGTGVMTTASERLQIIKYLDERSEKLADKHRATGDESAREFLNGPTQVPAASRFASSPTVNIMPQADGSVDIRVIREAEVVEGIMKELSEANPVQTAPESPPLQLEEVDLNHLAAQRLSLQKGSSGPKEP